MCNTLRSEVIVGFSLTLVELLTSLYIKHIKLCIDLVIVLCVANSCTLGINLLISRLPGGTPGHIIKT
jgi:hypothetical protein